MTGMPAKVSVFVVLVLLSGVAAANVGIPFLGIHAVYSILLFIPIVAIESLVVKTGIPIGAVRVIGYVLLANVASTSAGLLIALATYRLPFGAPPGTFADIVVLVLLLPFFFLSVFIETHVMRWLMKDVDRTLLTNRIRLANVASYSMFAIFIVTRIIKSYIVNGYFV